MYCSHTLRAGYCGAYKPVPNVCTTAADVCCSGAMKLRLHSSFLSAVQQSPLTYTGICSSNAAAAAAAAAQTINNYTRYTTQQKHVGIRYPHVLHESLLYIYAGKCSVLPCAAVAQHISTLIRDATNAHSQEHGCVVAGLTTSV